MVMRPALASFCLAAALCSAGDRAALACELTVARACLSNEDSHPHEIAPGARARFYIDADRAGQRVDVKCFLTGPVTSARVDMSGIAPRGTVAGKPEFAVGASLDIDIEGTVLSPGETSFDLVNGDDARLLWHQCYNN